MPRQSAPIRVVELGSKGGETAAPAPAPSAEALLTAVTQQVATLLSQHQLAVADLVSKVSIPAPAPVIIQREAPPSPDTELADQFAALREILLLHQMKVEALIEALRAASAEAQQSRVELMAVVRAKGRIADIKVSYNEQGQIISVIPVYKPL